MEHIVFFFDFSLMVILMVLIYVVYLLTFMGASMFLRRFLVDNQLLEFLWTVFPIFIIFGLAFPSIRILYLIDEIKHPALTCKAMGHQWFWSYEYSDFGGISFDSYIVTDRIFRLLSVDNCFILPVGVKVRLLIRSFDVLHS
jgi:cytochrome c oxidase subunit 2